MNIYTSYGLLCARHFSLALSVFVTLTLTFPIPLLCEVAMHAVLLNRLVLVFYRDSAVLVVCPSHVFKGPTCLISLVNFCKGDGLKNF